MKLSYMFVAALVIVGGSPIARASAAAPQTRTAATSDKAIADRIEARIARDASLKKYDVKVSVDAGVATLKGTVPTEADRAKAAELATLSGATRVENHLVADLDAATHAKGTTGKIEQKTGEAVDKTKEVGGKAVDKTKEGAEKVGEVATDGWITSRAKTKFIGEDLLKDSDIHVSTDDHVVTLTGYVMSAAGRARAVEIVKSIEGVHRVVDKIAVK